MMTKDNILYQVCFLEAKRKFMQKIVSLGPFIFFTKHVKQLKIHGLEKYSTDYKIALITKSSELKLPSDHKKVHAKNCICK